MKIKESGLEIWVNSHGSQYTWRVADINEENCVARGSENTRSEAGRQARKARKEWCINA